MVHQLAEDLEQIMGKKLESISPELAAWISEQHLFFVATAPLANDGLVNLSPKGLDSFRVIGKQQVAYLDLTGSGAPTEKTRLAAAVLTSQCDFDVRPHRLSDCRLVRAQSFRGGTDRDRGSIEH